MVWVCLEILLILNIKNTKKQIPKIVSYKMSLIRKIEIYNYGQKIWQKYENIKVRRKALMNRSSPFGSFLHHRLVPPPPHSLQCWSLLSKTWARQFGPSTLYWGRDGRNMLRREIHVLPIYSVHSCLEKANTRSVI